MDPLQRAMAAAESAKSHAYNMEVAAQAMKRKIESLERDVTRLIEHVRQQDRNWLSKVASLESDVGALQDAVNQLVTRFGGE